MKKISVVFLLAALVAAVPFVAQANGDSLAHVGNFFAYLSGGQEVPAISTAARGKALIRLRPAVSVADAGATLDYWVGWDGLEGDVLQSHIHFGARGTNGGVIAFLCSNLNSTPLDVPTCPQRGIISGSIGPDQIVGPGGQGIAPGEFREALDAMRQGLVYVNVHTSDHPGGELRGQVQRRFGTIDTQLDPTVTDVDEFIGQITDVRSR